MAGLGGERAAGTVARLVPPVRSGGGPGRPGPRRRPGPLRRRRALHPPQRRQGAGRVRGGADRPADRRRLPRAHRADGGGGERAHRARRSREGVDGGRRPRRAGGDLAGPPAAGLAPARRTARRPPGRAAPRRPGVPHRPPVGRGTSVAAAGGEPGDPHPARQRGAGGGPATLPVPRRGGRDGHRRGPGGEAPAVPASPRPRTGRTRRRTPERGLRSGSGGRGPGPA